MACFQLITTSLQSHKDRLVSALIESRQRAQFFFRKPKDIPTEPPKPPGHRARGPPLAAGAQGITKDSKKDSEGDSKKDPKKDPKDPKKPKGPKD